MYLQQVSHLAHDFDLVYESGSYWASQRGSSKDLALRGCCSVVDWVVTSLDQADVTVGHPATLIKEASQ